MKKLAVTDSTLNLHEKLSIKSILDKIDAGRTQIKEGKINSEEQLNAKLAKWLS